jgi:hypothetical protein
MTIEMLANGKDSSIRDLSFLVSGKLMPVLGFTSQGDT